VKVQHINPVLQPRTKRPLEWKQTAADVVTIGVGCAAGALFGSVGGGLAGAGAGAGAESMVASDMVMQKNSTLIVRQAVVGAAAGLGAGLTTSLLHHTLGALEPLVGLGVGLALGGAAAALLPQRAQSPVKGHWTNLETTQAPELWKQGITGAGVGVAVLDTGLDMHPSLRATITGFHNFVDDNQETHDSHYHGTAMSGIISGQGKDGNYPGVAPHAQIIGLKVADEKGRVLPEKVAQAIRWASENRERYNIQVLNMSFAGDEKDDPAQLAEVARAVEEASAKGIIVVASAGNNGPTRTPMLAPASASSALAVASQECHGQKDAAGHTISGFSHRSPEGEAHATVAAPGTDWLEPVTGGNYWVEGGTSQAAAALSGVIALWKQANPALTSEQARAALQHTSQKLNAPEDAQGAGSVRAQAGLDYLRTLK